MPRWRPAPMRSGWCSIPPARATSASSVRVELAQPAAAVRHAGRPVRQCRRPPRWQRAVDAIPQLLLQFHGDETPADCRHGGPAVLRAARMEPGLDLLDFAARFSDAQALLLDTHVAGYGGSGKVFDWSLIPAGLACPVVLSGGLSAGNVGDGILQVRPWAVDVSSGVESSKGIKDAAAMRRFCNAVRQADRVASTIDRLPTDLKAFHRCRLTSNPMPKGISAPMAAVLSPKPWSMRSMN